MNPARHGGGEFSGSPYRLPERSPFFHVVNVSGGRSSGYLLHQVLQAHGGALPPRTAVVFCNTGKERPETLDFIQAMGERWSVPIHWLEFRYEAREDGTRYQAVEVDYATASRDGEPFDAMLDAVSYIPNRVLRVCTSELKVKTTERWLWRERGLTKRQVKKLLGIRFDEPARWRRGLYAECRTDYPLVRAHVRRADVAAFWAAQDFDLGIPSDRGNCDCCFLKGRGNLLATIRDNPRVADWWIRAEARKGKRFRQDASFEDLKAMALGQREVVGAGQGEQLDCFCGD